MKVGRNEPCPCDSGRKVKRCCGVEGVRRWRETAHDVFSAALCFPRLRPTSSTFDDWAAAPAAEWSREELEQGLGALGEVERERIVAAARNMDADVWAGFVRDLGGEEHVVPILLLGAVVAGLDERDRPLDPDALDLLEHDPDVRADPVEALALVLEPRDLWSVIESALAVEAIDAAHGAFADTALPAAADRLATPWHDERLLVLVERLCDRLPDPSFPLASAALTDACRAVAEDDRLRRRLRAELLLDSLPTIFDALRLAA
jgi:hypothetical protein